MFSFWHSYPIEYLKLPVPGVIVGVGEVIVGGTAEEVGTVEYIVHKYTVHEKNVCYDVLKKYAFNWSNHSCISNICEWIYKNRT